MTDAQIVIVVATLLVGLLALYVAFRLLRGLYRLVTGKKPVRKIQKAKLPRRARDWDPVKLPGIYYGDTHISEGGPTYEDDGVFYDSKMHIIG